MIDERHRHLAVLHELIEELARPTGERGDHSSDRGAVAQQPQEVIDALLLACRRLRTERGEGAAEIAVGHPLEVSGRGAARYPHALAHSGAQLEWAPRRNGEEEAIVEVALCLVEVAPFEPRRQPHHVGALRPTSEPGDRHEDLVGDRVAARDRQVDAQGPAQDLGHLLQVSGGRGCASPTPPVEPGQRATPVEQLGRRGDGQQVARQPFGTALAELGQSVQFRIRHSLSSLRHSTDSRSRSRSAA